MKNTLIECNRPVGTV